MWKIGYASVLLWLTGCAGSISDYSVETYNNRFAGSSWEARALADEAELLSIYPDIAVRKGRTLTIVYSGKIVAILTAVSDTSSGCDSFIMNKVLRLYNQQAGRWEHIAVVTCHIGEFGDMFVISPMGERISMPYPTASPDGHWLVSGDNDAVQAEYLSGRLSAYSWPSMDAVHFPVNCKPLGWHGNELWADCMYDRTPRPKSTPFDELLDNDNFLFHARAWVNDKGDWQMQSTDAVPSSAEMEKIYGDVPGPPPPDPNAAPLSDPHLSFTATH